MAKQLLFRVALGHILREERQAQGLIMRQVIEQAGMALGYLSEVERGEKEISSEVLDKLAHDGLGVETSELIIRTGILMSEVRSLPSTEIPDTAEELIRYFEERAGALK